MPGSQSETAHAEPNYLAVFVVLAVLTAIEVGVTYLPISRLAAVLIFLVLAVAKATFVVLYYMHLKFDSRLLAVIFTVPLLLGGALIYFLVI